MQRGYVIWFTGLPCSGKTTLSKAVSDKLTSIGKEVEILDGDIIRKELSNDLGFSKEDRYKNLMRVSLVANLLIEKGIIILASFVSPYRAVRNEIRAKFGDKFIEIYVKASPEECMKRDVKGMYLLAKQGKIKEFTGYDSPYEEPINPEIIIDTEKHSINDSIEIIISYLKKERLI